LTSFDSLSEPDRLRVLNDNLHKGRRRLLRELTNDYAKGKVSKEEINQFLQSWFAHLDHGDTLCGRQQMLADLYWFGLVKNFLRCVAL
jgi:glutathione S-transferase